MVTDLLQKNFSKIFTSDQQKSVCDNAIDFYIEKVYEFINRALEFTIFFYKFETV